MSPQPTGAPQKERAQRAVVALSPESERQLDALIERAAQRTKEALGYSVTPKRSDVIAGLIRDAHEASNGAAA